MKALNNIIFNQVKFSKAYLVLTFIFVTIIAEVKVIPSIFSKLMLLWGMVISAGTVYNTYKKSKGDRVLYLVLALFLIQLISILFTKIGSNELIALIINFFFIFVIGFSTLNDYSAYQKDFLRLLKLFVYISFVLSIFALYFLVTKTKLNINGNLYGYVNSMMFTGVYINENTQGIISFISIALSLALIFSKRGTVELCLYGINIVLQFKILINSKANSAALALAVFVAIIIFIYFNNKIFRVAYGVLLMVVPLYVLRKIVVTNKLEALLNGRYELWTTAIKVIKNNLFFGVGNSNLVSSMQKATNQALEGIEGGGLHNIFLQVMAINGVFMLLLFIAILFIVYFWGIKQIDKVNSTSNKIFDTIIIATSISILFINMFEANIVYMVSCISIIFWSLVGYIYRSFSVNGGI